MLSYNKLESKIRKPFVCNQIHSLVHTVFNTPSVFTCHTVSNTVSITYFLLQVAVLKTYKTALTSNH